MITGILRKLRIIKSNTNSIYNGIEFRGGNGKAYQIIPEGMHAAQDCYGYIGGIHVCTFELMSLSLPALQINHFAVTGSNKGKKLGEQCLRGFALLVSEQTPSITEMNFFLYKAVSVSDINNLSIARANLLNKIGAAGVSVSQPSPTCREVSGTWNKPSW
jgi:hypothetical protein